MSGGVVREVTRRHRRSRSVRVAVVAVLILAGCSSADDGVDQSVAPRVIFDDTAGIEVVNEGGSLEGHTPRGFAGSGTGLFAGDDLNPSFPDDDGVQLFLTFELPEPLPDVTTAALTSDVMQTRGSPFADLGALLVDRVAYDEFGPQIFDTPALGEPVVCEREGDVGLRCDVADAAATVAAEGGSRLQLRLRFEGVADGDGQQDLVLFFREDADRNEPGLFLLSVG